MARKPGSHETFSSKISLFNSGLRTISVEENLVRLLHLAVDIGYKVALTSFLALAKCYDGALLSCKTSVDDKASIK